MIVTSSKGVSRGQADGPLIPQGKAEAQRLGARLAAKGGLTCLYLSNAQRVRETADFIIKACPATELETPVPDILSWALGELEGKPVVEAQPKIANFAKYLPDITLPGVSSMTGKRGESFDDFRWRVLPYIGQQMAEVAKNPKLKLGILTHHRVVKLLAAWVAGGLSPFMCIDHRSFNDPAEMGHPGSGWDFHPVGGGKWVMEPLLLGSNEKLQGGHVYVLRHASTKLNSGGGTPSSGSPPLAK